MTGRCEFFEKLPLAAFDALDPREERELRGHLAACPACASELEDLRRLTAGIRGLPTPVPPPALVERVRRVVHLELAGGADERLNRIVLAFLLLFSWTLTIVSFFAVRLVTSGNVFGWVTDSSLPWSAVYFVAAWLTGAAALVVVGLRYRRDRRERSPA